MKALILAVLLGVPVSAQVIVQANTALTVAWTPNASTDLVTAYRCYLDGVKVGLDVAAGTTTCTLPGVPVGSHVVAVTAVNATGESAPSPIPFTAGTVQPPPTTGVPRAPSNVRLVTATSGSAATIPPATSLVDASGDTWTLQGTRAAKNGSTAIGGSGTQLQLVSGVIVLLGTDGIWYRWTGTAWVQTVAP